MLRAARVYVLSLSCVNRDYDNEAKALFRCSGPQEYECRRVPMRIREALRRPRCQDQAEDFRGIRYRRFGGTIFLIDQFSRPGFSRPDLGQLREELMQIAATALP